MNNILKYKVDFGAMLEDVAKQKLEAKKGRVESKSQSQVAERIETGPEGFV